ncbi:MAG TPA: formate dehydrogenase accessory sulfurtransferase FdhD [Anaerolineales bacterium]|nr:formate dehydrogenase accessory sulfurtransferase FdhD [Anaerolineales bacterium]HUV27637.1 formate dehydrogenase accessory sulfurtransferase FdhD [Anaerolineales bacterium]
MKTDVNTVKFQQFRSGKATLGESDLIVEEPVALYVNGQLWITFMCTPNQLKALAIGFLYNEGVIESPDQVAETHICDNREIIDVWLQHEAEKPKEWKRTSGCTGGYTALDLDTLIPEVKDGVSLESDQVRHLVERLFESQDLYKKTGGVHTSILTDGDQIIISAEDVGRHNSLDKIAGLYLFGNEIFTKKILLSTGRISSDMLQKSARIGAAIVISRTSPTSLSVELAEKWGITLIGYARRDRFNLYTHPDRIIESNSSGVHHAMKKASP